MVKFTTRLLKIKICISRYVPITHPLFHSSLALYLHYTSVIDLLEGLPNAILHVLLPHILIQNAWYF
jgi:hypothetical protein